MDVTVVIPCRAGSTRVKNKNFRSFGGSNLLEIKVNQAKSLGLPTVVNSDSEIAKEIAKKHNVYLQKNLVDNNRVSIEKYKTYNKNYRYKSKHFLY